ncbi:hypothetical protein E7811_04990 [Aliigemmobacter aestuarii]|uniref:Uncharacterized protein n=1 Tax=Aliigemmobacter aestuarii TaxID=1445661 RepID=A0A4S3MRK7_9RHOB|nr:putative nucleotide-diphospho-sugar transferase [Gemmobacter aestuarii]THD85077.1 hypothetical protein E7811_04990 [Gemmobacter aestuarii]
MTEDRTLQVEDPAPARGFVLAATGEGYRKLARRAARTVRSVMPDIAIDLFTDSPLDDPVFDRVHLLEAGGPRPKMEALRRSRFERTVYLDCDVVMVAPVPELFEVLKETEFAGAHELYGSSPVHLQKVRREIPHAFRQVNSGVLGVRKTPRTEAFLQRWQDDFVALKLMFDQPLLRELLYENRDGMRVVILPMEYNQMHPATLRVSSNRMMAPRFLHLTRLHEDDSHQEPVDQPFDVAALLTPPMRDKLNSLIRTDRTLGAARDFRTYVGDTFRKAPFVYRLARKVRRFFT